MGQSERMGAKWSNQMLSNEHRKCVCSAFSTDSPISVYFYSLWTNWIRADSHFIRMCMADIYRNRYMYIYFVFFSLNLQYFDARAMWVRLHEWATRETNLDIYIYSHTERAGVLVIQSMAVCTTATHTHTHNTHSKHYVYIYNIYTLDTYDRHIQNVFSSTRF